MKIHTGFCKSILFETFAWFDFISFLQNVGSQLCFKYLRNIWVFQREKNLVLNKTFDY